ncbi:hypothetical protein ACTFRP_21945 [Bacillus cereus group sp. MYBK234-1]|uniref:Uncharacterized protein n=1 Tax=Bacillus thuringiensis TaxID=1428 RepID=A0A9W3SIB7_BACTU|nr:hypothetical protein [Bacillus thuringiensis]ANS51968.1 hypothetical protein BT246_66760 [Bacillus thuringiensis]MBG9520641.1 hypothetical protein [Bacillus thuringiensis]MBH0336294.1 hypothetical protein [Bacillus thuringiensis]
MEKVSQHVLDILSAGIAEYTQNITLMMMAYEDGLDMVEIEEIQSVYEKLETTMMFYQSHATGPDRLLSQELYIRLQETMRRMMGEEVQKPDERVSRKLSTLPKGVTVHTEDGEHTYYVFHHEILGHIGRLFVRAEGPNSLHVEAEMAEGDKGNLVKERMLQRIVETFEKDILGVS